jgi:hypothetical protein
MSQSLLPFFLFALVSSISPGPTNLLILAHGARVGLRASQRRSWQPAVRRPRLCCWLVWGWASCCCVTLGPTADELGRVLWLSWLAWKMLRSAAARCRRPQRKASVRSALPRCRW